MEISTKRLKLYPLPIAELRLLITDCRTLCNALGLSSALSEPDNHLSAAYSQMLSACELHIGKYEWYTVWLIINSCENKAVGTLGFMGEPGVNGEVEIGYGIDKENENRGYATEALGGAVLWAHNNGADTVFALTEPDNIGSIKVCQKSGFRKVGEKDGLLLFCADKKPLK